MPISLSPWDSGSTNNGNGIMKGGGGGVGQVLATDATACEAGYVQQVLSEGPIFGLVNGLKDVKLDGTPILDSAGHPNFTGLAFALTAGTNTQAMIPGFTDVESETSVNVKVYNATPVTRTISTTGISAIRVRIAIPTLKVINATSGAESGAQVQVKIERQSASWNGGAWETLALEGVGVISGKFGSKYTKAYRVDTPAAGPWSIRVTRLTADHTSGAPDYTQDETWWDAYTEITDVKLRMPYSSVAALRVNAQQFQQIPKLTMKLRGLLIQVPSNYNPTTRVYTGIWDGTFQIAWSDSPAWVWYDLASNTRYGAGTVLQASKIDKWTLYTIAQYCDQLVSDGNGGTEPRFRCNLYLQSQDEALKVLGDLASVFRGMVYSAGGMVTAVQDVDGPIDSIFTASNVIDGRFSYMGAARKSRHSAALVSWMDPNNGYQASVEYVEDQTAIARYGYNPTQVSALGATSQAQARRLGVWLLLTEGMSTETVTFSAGLEGSTPRPGAIIGVQDQFRAAAGRLGGRCAAGCTTTVIQLDSTITLPAGTQTLYVRLPDGTVQSRTVTTSAGSVSALTVSSAFTVAPNALSQWALGVALYRVISIKKGDGITYDITALEHNPAKYALVDATTITPGSVAAATTLAPPSGITLADVVRVEKDKLVQSLTASWSGTAVSYEAEASLDYGPWQPMKVNALAATLEPIVPGTWRVRARGTYAAGVSAWATSSRTVATPTQTATDAGAAAAAAAAAQATGNQLNSVDYLTNAAKISLIQQWKAESQTQTQLDSAASVLGVSSSAYDSAVAALSAGLIAAGAPSSWATAWPDGTTSGPWTGIGNNLATWWAAIATQRSPLQTNISHQQALNAQAAAIASAATNVIAQLNTMSMKNPTTAAWASTAKPALPNGTYPAGSCWLSTDGFEFQVSTDGTIWEAVTVAATGLFGKLVAGQLTVANFDNLVPNPGGQISNPPSNSLEAQGQYNVGTSLGTAITTTGYVRVASVGTAGGSSILQVANVTCSPGDSFFAQAGCISDGVSGGGSYISIQFVDKNGANTGGNQSANVPTDTQFHVLTTTATAPANTANAILWLNNITPSAPRNAYFGQLYMRLMSDANVIVDGTLQALMVRIAKAIQSYGYLPGTSTTPPQGFCLDGTNTGFTSYLLDGTTMTAQMELGQGINLAGWKADAVTSRVIQALSNNGQSGSSFRVWYRGNNDPSTLSGRPNISRLTVIPSYVTTAGGQIDLSVQPSVPADNLDALIYAKIETYSQSSVGTTATLTANGVYYLPLGGRLYGNTTLDSDTLNAVKASQITRGFASNVPACKITIYGINGSSDTHCFYAASGWTAGTALTDNGTTWPSGISGASSGGTGTGGGGSHTVVNPTP